VTDKNSFVRQQSGNWREHIARQNSTL